MTEILTAKLTFVEGVLAGTLLNDFRENLKSPSLLELDEEGLIRHIEICYDAAPGTYRFLEKCRHFGIKPTVSVVKGVYTSWDQTEIILPEGAPEELENRLRGVMHAQASEDKQEAALWYQEKKKREQWF